MNRSPSTPSQLGSKVSRQVDLIDTSQTNLATPERTLSGSWDHLLKGVGVHPKNWDDGPRSSEAG